MEKPSIEMSRGGPRKKLNKAKKKHPSKRWMHGAQFLSRLCQYVFLAHPDLMAKMPTGAKPLEHLTKKEHLSRTRNVVRTYLGTQEPTIRLTVTQAAITMTGGGFTAQVISVDPSGNADWAAGYSLIFDEYQIQKAKLHIVPWNHVVSTSTTVGTNSLAMPTIAVVDYDNSTALASAAAALQYDTHKIFYLGIPQLTKKSSGSYELDYLPQGIPDKSWYDTGSITITGWFKLYSLIASSLVSTSVGDMYVTIDIKFRQVS